MALPQLELSVSHSLAIFIDNTCAGESAVQYVVSVCNERCEEPLINLLVVMTVQKNLGHVDLALIVHFVLIDVQACQDKMQLVELVWWFEHVHIENVDFLSENSHRVVLREFPPASILFDAIELLEQLVFVVPRTDYFALIEVQSELVPIDRGNERKLKIQL